MIVVSYHSIRYLVLHDAFFWNSNLSRVMIVAVTVMWVEVLASFNIRILPWRLWLSTPRLVTLKLFVLGRCTRVHAGMICKTKTEVEQYERFDA